MQHQGEEPIDFDWLVRGICGIQAVPELMTMVRAKEPFGSYIALLDLPDLPSVPVDATAMRDAAMQATSAAVSSALNAAADVLPRTMQCMEQSCRRSPLPRLRHATPIISCSLVHYLLLIELNSFLRKQCMRTAIATENAPAAIGAYSQAVRQGDLLYISGQLGLDPTTGQFAGASVAEQATQALDNLSDCRSCWIEPEQGR